MANEPISSLPVASPPGANDLLALDQVDGTSPTGYTTKQLKFSAISSGVGPPGPATLGGVYSNAGSPHAWVSSINTDGSVTLTQPSYSDISGTPPGMTIPPPQPAALGGVYSNSGSPHTWVVSINTDGTASLLQPSYADISGAVPSTAMPLPGPSALGGVLSNAGAAHQWIQSINTNGTVTLSQPSYSDLSGTPPVAPPTMPISITAYDANANIGTTSYQQSISYTFNVDNFLMSSAFPIVEGMHLNLYAFQGQQLYNGSGAGQTDAKATFQTLGFNSTFYGSGQKFADVRALNDYANGDCFLHGAQHVFFAGGNAPSDEGKGIGRVNIVQQAFLSLPSITAVRTKSVVNATTTQAISRSNVAQVVAITGTPPAIGDWVIVEQSANPAGVSNAEAVQVTAVGSGNFGAIFVNNHPSGVTVLPATVITVNDISNCGQDRLVVNLSQPSYSLNNITGLVQPNKFTGSGTVWSNTMVGGNALNIGAISIFSDVIASGPFSGSPGTPNGPLNSWYQIQSVNSATSLTIMLQYSFNSPGASQYRGWFSPPSTYVISPAARIMWAAPGSTAGPLSGSGVLVLEYSTSTWAVNDTLEVSITPTPTIKPIEIDFGGYTTGTFCNYAIDLVNIGATSALSGVYLDGTKTIWGRGGAYGFNTGFVANGCGTPLVGSNNVSFGLTTNGYGNTMSYLEQADAAPLYADYYSYGTGLTLRSFAANGTKASPTPLTAGWFGAGLGLHGYNGVGSLANAPEQAGIYLVTQNTWSSTDTSTNIQFYTTRRGTAGAGNEILAATVNDFTGLTLAPQTFANLPASSSNAGAIVYITDSTTATIGAAIAGGGSNKVFACSKGGANWLVMA